MQQALSAQAQERRHVHSASGSQLKGLRQVGLGTSSVTLTWTPVPGGSPYTVYRDGRKIGSVRGASFTDTGLRGPASHRYTVRDRYGQESSVTARVGLRWPRLRAQDARSIALITTYPSLEDVLLGRVEGGTGFVVSPACDILTAYHVVRSAHLFIDVALPGDALVHARVLASDPGKDLALLAVPAGTGCGPPLAFAAQPPADGTSIGLLGHRGLRELALASGAVLGQSEPVDVTSLGILHEFPFRASVDPGDSGAPLLNRLGQVVGVVDARSSGTIGYAVPGTAAAAFVRRVAGAP